MSIDSVSGCDHSIDPDDSVFLGRPDDFDENSPVATIEKMDILTARHACEMLTAAEDNRFAVRHPLSRASKPSTRGKKSRKTR